MTKEKYYFCFQINELILTNNVQEQLSAQTHFKFDILKNHHSIENTLLILCQPTQEGIIKVDQSLRFISEYQSQNSKSNPCELQLLEQIPGGTRLIGCYQFNLDNYIKASKDLNRKCIEMKVEIGQDFITDYVVYLQTTLQALDKIIDQHSNAKALRLLSEISDSNDFLSNELQNENEQEEIQTIQYDLQSPLIIHQRFWSPNRFRKQQKTSSQIKIITSDKQIQQSVQKNQPQGNFLKLNKTPSMMSDNTSNSLRKRNFKKKQRKLSGIMQKEVAQHQQKDPYQQRHNMQHLYQVVCNDSKITSPLASDRDNPNKKKVEKAHFLLQTFSKHKILIIIICFVLMVILALSSKTDLRKVKKKSKKRNKYNK